MSEPTIEADYEDIWRDDLLGRREDADTIIRLARARVRERMAASRDGCYVINVDGAWGSGKTFFMERLARQLRAMDFIVATVNAWQDDSVDDPLVPVLSSINDAISSDPKKSKLKVVWKKTMKLGLKKAAGIIGKHAAIAAGRYIAGRAVDQFGHAIGELDEAATKAARETSEKLSEKLIDPAAEVLIDAYTKGKGAAALFREGLKSMLGDGKSEALLFVLVDELDRCRPRFAVELLERVKHLFNVDRVVFIFATDTSQLKCAIRAIYGESFDGNRYLHRFFDRTYTFADPHLRAFMASLFKYHGIDEKKLSSPPENDHVSFFVALMQSQGLVPRDAEQCFDILKDVVSLWEHQVPLELAYLLPLIVAFQQRDKELFAALKNWHRNEVMSKLKRPGELENVKFKRFRDDGWRSHEAEPETVAVSTIVGAFLAVFEQRLDKDRSGGPRHGLSGWVERRFEDEFRMRYGGGWRREDPMRSMVHGYAELVRRAGKLS